MHGRRVGVEGETNGVTESRQSLAVSRECSRMIRSGLCSLEDSIGTRNNKTNQLEHNYRPA